MYTNKVAYVHIALDEQQINYSFKKIKNPQGFLLYIQYLIQNL